MDFSVPMDKNVVKKEDEKVEKYQLLAQEIRKHRDHTGRNRRVRDGT